MRLRLYFTIFIMGFFVAMFFDKVVGWHEVAGTADWWIKISVQALITVVIVFGMDWIHTKWLSSRC